jgi:hypothetical protein
MRTWTYVFAAAVLASPFLASREARACGACVAPPPDQSSEPPPLVASHRMVLSMSTDRTILWDQIRFVGAASEFAWILPVKPGATVEVASDAWIDTLDAVTSPRIVSAFPACVEEFSSCSTSGSRAASAGCGDAGFEGVAPPPDVAPPVDIVSRESVGPYEIVILRTDSDESLRDWLDEHEFAIPADLDPIIDDYIDEGFDFAAMRLVPAAGVTQMRPVRVVQPGAVPVLPLRMVVGGAGAFTPISLMVVTEGRYHPANFPFAEVSPLSVLLDPATGLSNYAQVRDDLMTQLGNSQWVVSHASRGALFQRSTNPTNTLPVTYRVSQASSGGTNWSYETFAEAYVSQGFINGETSSMECADTLLSLANDGRRVVDPCDDEGACRAVDPTTEIDVRDLECDAPIGSDYPFDDLAAALVGLHPKDVWITRLDANLSKQAMTRDLELRAASRQEEQPLFFVPSNVQEPECDDGATVARLPRGSVQRGTSVTLILAGLFLAGRRLLRKNEVVS